MHGLVVPLASASPAKSKEFYSPQEISDMVDLHVAVIRRAVDRGELRAYKICGKLRISRPDYEAWLDLCLVRT